MQYGVGDWIRRRGKWHLVESVVAEDAVTRCGRRMDRVTASGGELQVSAVMPLTRMIGQPHLCRAGCDRPGMVVFNNEDDETRLSPEFQATLPTADDVLGILREDDGSTQPETVP